MSCCNSWGCKESDTTEWLNWTELNWCPLIWWCYPTISSSVFPFSSCLQPFPASGSFPMSWFFVLGGQMHWNFSFSIRPPSEYSALISFRIDWLDLFAVQGTLKSLLQHHSSKALVIQYLAFFFLWSSSHIYTWPLEKPYLWLYGPLLAKYCLCFSICFWICYLGWS